MVFREKTYKNGRGQQCDTKKTFQLIKNTSFSLNVHVCLRPFLVSRLKNSLGAGIRRQTLDELDK